VRRVFKGLLLLFLLAITLAGALIATEEGSRWLMRATLHSAGASAARIEGTVWRGLRIRELQWRQAGQAFQAGYLGFRWRPLELLGGRLRLLELEGSDLVVTLPSSPSSPEPPGFDIRLPLWFAVDHLRITDLEIHHGPDTYPLQRVEGALHIDDQSLRVQIAALEAYGGGLEGDARMALARPNALQADLRWQGVLAELGDVHASATLGGDLTAPQIDARLTRPFVFSAKGIVDLSGDAPRLDLAGHWEKLRWPLEETPEVASREGRYHITGPLDAYRLEAEARLTTWRFDDAPLQLDAQGDSRGFDTFILQGELIGGNARAQGSLHWSPSLAWKADLSGEGLDPATLEAGWPGSLELNSAVEGRVADDGLHLDVHLDTLKGRLRGYPVSGNGAFAMDGDRYRFETVRLQSGDNRLDLNGHIADTLNLDFRLDAPQMAALLPDLGGRIKGNCHIGGRPERPEVQLEATLAQLRYREMAAESGKLQVNWRKNGGQGEMRLIGATLAGIPGQEITLRLDGAPKRHTLALTSHSPRFELTARAEGGWRAPRWTGELTRFDLRHLKAGDWRLRRPAALALSAKRYRIGRLCLQQKAAALCAAGGLEKEKLTGEMEIAGLPLTLLSPWLPAGYSAEGGTDGKFILGGTLEQPELTGHLLLPKGRLTLRVKDRPPHPVRFADGRIDLDYRQARLKLSGRTAIESSGALNARLDAGPEKAGIRPLEGRVQLVFTDLAPFRTLLPQIEGLKGRVHGDFHIAGTTERPRIAGELKLEEAGARIPALGITLEEVQVALRSTGADRLALKGSARSGEGALKIGGDLQLNAARGWPMTLQIEGNDITFLQRSEIFATASPNLRLKRSGGRTSLDGRIYIPKAEITLDTLPEGAVTVSKDEVIVDTRKPEAPVPPAGAGLPLEGRVRVTLGDEVRFKGLGLTSRLKGDIDVRTASKGTNAYGELTLAEGRYKAYGQDLGIDRGRLLFAGPLDNPGLNVRAVRPSNDGSVTAVVQISGTARAPQTRVFTEPPTSGDDALSYLLTGDPIDRLGEGERLDLKREALGYGLEKLSPAFSTLGSRVGLDELKLSSDAITIGKRLSPKLYVGYLVDLFDSESIWLLRYQINRFLQLETRSGEQKSVDLLYSYERD